MPKVSLTNEIEIDESTYRLLQRATGVTETSAMRRRLENLTAAAFHEYVSMIAQHGLPTQAQDFQQRRVLNLILYYFDGECPDETQLSRLLRVSPSKCRTLLANTQARFQSELSSATPRSVLNLLNVANPEDANDQTSRMKVRVTSRFMYLQILDIVASLEGDPLSIERQPARPNTLSIPRETFNALKQYCEREAQ